MADVAEPFDAADPAAEANAAREAKRAERNDADALRSLLHSKNGRAFFYRWLEKCHIYASTFAPGQADVTAFQLGEENIGKKLMNAAMDASPDLYLLMIKEQREEAKRLDAVREREAENRAQKEKPLDPKDLMVDLPPPGSAGKPTEKPKGD